MKMLNFFSAIIFQTFEQMHKIVLNARTRFIFEHFCCENCSIDSNIRILIHLMISLKAAETWILTQVATLSSEQMSEPMCRKNAKILTKSC